MSISFTSSKKTYAFVYIFKYADGILHAECIKIVQGKETSSKAISRRMPHKNLSLFYIEGRSLCHVLSGVSSFDVCYRGIICKLYVTKEYMSRSNCLQERTLTISVDWCIAILGGIRRVLKKIEITTNRKFLFPKPLLFQIIFMSSYKKIKFRGLPKGCKEFLFV